MVSNHQPSDVDSNVKDCPNFSGGFFCVPNLLDTMSVTRDWNPRFDEAPRAHSSDLTPIDAIARGHGRELPAIISPDTYNADRSVESSNTSQLLQNIFQQRPSTQEINQDQDPVSDVDDRSNTEPSSNMERKIRGRPRLEVSGSSAADKRRTQIRVAQRKYRERKETTIAELKEDIAELHELLQKTNLSVKQLYSTLDSTGLLDALPADHAIQKQLKKLLDRADEITERLGEPRDDEAP